MEQWKIKFLLNIYKNSKFFFRKVEFCKLKIQTGAVFIFEYAFFKRKRVFKIVYKLFKFIESNTKWSTVICDGIFSRVLQFVFFHR